VILTLPWNQFSEEEFTHAIAKCNNSSAPDPDKLSWRYLKYILKDKLCLGNIIKIANMCIKVGYWPTHFKSLTTIVIPKPNKAMYNIPKSSRPIVLLNTLGKLIEKVIDNRLQFHPSKLTRRSQIQVYYRCWYSINPLHLYRVDKKPFNKHSHFWHCAVLSIAQPPSPHSHSQKSRIWFSHCQFLFKLLDKQKNPILLEQFYFFSLNVNMGVGQSLALSPILSALYLIPFLHILENHLKNLNL